MRLAAGLTAPVLENDFERYLWDGAVTAAGLNPYAVAPAEARDGGPGWRRLAAVAGDLPARINHPDLKTVYPPTAQAAFALAHLVRPWSLGAWRAVLAAFDLAALGLLALLLRLAGRSPGRLLVYWWNPLLVKEVYNSAHVDVVALPLVLLALLLALRGRPAGTGGVLGLAAGVKLWPALLLPAFLRRAAGGRWSAGAAGGLAFAVAAAVLAVPVVAGGLDPSSGLVAYADRWEMNDGPFMLVLWGWRGLLGSAGGAAPALARATVAAVVAVLAARAALAPPGGPAETASRALVPVAALFLLGPTQFPWYFTWMLPLLVFRPSPGLLAYTALLPLYYWRFAWEARGRVPVFDDGIVWVEHAPVLAILAWEWYRARARRAGGGA
nr:glycosyltransferase 87 family protein [Dissulfurirhabdus thermomarina]